MKIETRTFDFQAKEGGWCPSRTTSAMAPGTDPADWRGVDGSIRANSPLRRVEKLDGLFVEQDQFGRRGGGFGRGDEGMQEDVVGLRPAAHGAFGRVNQAVFFRTSLELALNDEALGVNQQLLARLAERDSLRRYRFVEAHEDDLLLDDDQLILLEVAHRGSAGFEQRRRDVDHPDARAGRVEQVAQQWPSRRDLTRKHVTVREQVALVVPGGWMSKWEGHGDSPV